MSDTQDHFLTLSICSPGPATLPQPEKRQVQPRDLNDTSDIDGAHPQPKYRLFTNKPQFLNSDIPGAVPKQLVRGRNTRDNSLYIDDIEGTRRTIKDRMMRTNRHVNPLEPNYPLPSFVQVEAPIVPFKRDPMNISDIDGTKPRPKKEFAPKDTMDISDIEGARPGLRETKRLNSLQTRDILEVQDVCRRTHRYVDRTQRVTDPCAPTYRVNGMEIRDGKESKPKEPPALIRDSHLLQTQDIVGATAGSRYASPFQRREVRNTNYIGDIEGAKHDTIKHSITTNRTTHPLQPVYQSLDPGELLLPLIPPLIPPELVKIPTLPPLNREKSAQASLTASRSGRPPAHPAASSGRLGQDEHGGGGSGGGGLDLGNTWGSAGSFSGRDRDNDLDPVLFTAQPGHGNNSNQAAASQYIASDNRGGSSGRRVERLSLPAMTSARDQRSGRDASPLVTGKERLMQTTGQLWSQRQQHEASQPTSQRNGHAYKVSPMTSGRAGGGGMSQEARRAEAQRLEEISLVRALQ